MRSTFRRAARAALFACSVAAVCLAAPRGALAGPPLDATTRDYDQLHLIVRVTPDIPGGTVDGEVTVRFAPRGGPLSVLRLHSLETTVLAATDVVGRPLAFALADGILSVTLAEPVPVGAETAVTVRYTSKPTAGLFFHAPTKASPSTPLEMYSQGEGRENRRWFPCYDESDDRTTCEVFVTVPPGLRSVGNGVLVESKPLDGGRRVEHWRLDRRIPSYLISLVVGTFETVTDTWRDVPLEYNGPPGRTDEIRKGYAGTPAMMEFFTEYTGRKFPWPRYAQTTVWDFIYGGMENAGATTMNMRLLHLPEACPCYSSDGLVAHELAHQWFGNLLTCKTFDHMWLNEGFATYFTDLFFEHRDGAAAFSLERWHQNRGYMNGTPRPDTLGLVPAPRGDLPLELHGGKEYNRGAAILHQLRIELGDEVFRAGVRRYVKDHDDRAVTSDDLRRSMEAAAGRSLAWFFDQWVYGAGYPVLKASWSVDGAAGSHRVRVVIEQTQNPGGGQPESFRLTVPWRWGGVTGRLDVRRRRQEFTLDVPEAKGGWLRLGDGGGTFARVEMNQPREAWIAQLAGDDDPTAQLEAIDALATWPMADTAAALARRFSYNGVLPQVRAAIVRGIAPMSGMDRFLPALLDPAVVDADPRVREAAAEVLGGRTRDQAGAAVSSLLADPSPYVRAAAARALGKLHVDGAFDTLRGLLVQDSHRETVRAGALDGLAALGDPRALEVASPFLAYEFARGDHHGMRQAALHLFVALAPDEPDTHARIVALLDDTYHRMRIWAAEAAGKLLVRKAKPRLEAMAANDPDGGAKNAAKTALERLAAADSKKK